MTTPENTAVQRAATALVRAVRAAPVPAPAGKTPEPERLEPSEQFSPFIFRNPVRPTDPFGIRAEQWRYIVARSPIAALCIRTLILQITAIPWKLVGDDEDEVTYYTDLIEAANGETFDLFVERLVQDMLSVPFGGAVEPVRYRTGELAGFYHVDGGTLFPTYEEDTPYIQVDPDFLTRRVLFKKGQLIRMMWAPMSDIRNYAWSKPPVMEVFGAVESLMRSDTFYSQFLSNTPEAGILDLMDMSAKSAKEWVTSWQEMMTGIDPFKLPVLYEHSEPAKFLPFSRSPADLALPEIFKRYAEIVVAAFGMNIGDLGLFEHENTLAGASRMQANSKRQGLGSIMRKLSNLINAMLPEEVAFEWNPLDEEDRLRRASADKIRSETLKILGTVDPGSGQPIFPVDLIRKQAVLDGLINVLEIDDVDGLTAKLEQQMAEHEAAAEKKAELLLAKQKQDAPNVPDQEDIPAGAPGSPESDQGQGGQRLLSDGAAEELPVTDTTLLEKAILDTIDEPNEFPEDAPYAKRFEKAVTAGFNRARRKIRLEHIELIVGQMVPPSDTERVLPPDIEIMILNHLMSLGYFDLAVDNAAILKAFQEAYTAGLKAGAEDIQRQLYELGRAATADLGVTFNLTNPEALAALEKRGLTLVKQLEEGTRTFMLQTFSSAFDEIGPGSPNALARTIYHGLSDNEKGAFSKKRVQSIVNTEMNLVHSTGRIEQIQAAGLTRKVWHAVTALACSICLSNAAKGPVPVDYAQFGSVFGGTSSPPGHPICRCRISADLEEIAALTELPAYWTGGEYVEPVTRELDKQPEDVTTVVDSKNPALPPEDVKPVPQRGLDKEIIRDAAGRIIRVIEHIVPTERIQLVLRDDSGRLSGVIEQVVESNEATP